MIAPRHDTGFTLVEVLIAVAIVGVLASIAVPSLLNARRQANQTAAVASLHAIEDAQHAFASSCARGFYASRLTQLSAPPIAGGEGFLAPDLGAADAVTKSGYQLTMARGTDGSSAVEDACNGISGHDLASSFYATARPESPGAGAYHYWMGVNGTIYAGTYVFTTTEGLSDAPGGQPLGSTGSRPIDQYPTGDPTRPIR